MNLRPIGIGIWLAAISFAFALPASGQWRNSQSVDEMTGDKSCYALGPSTTPTKELSFPYGDVTASIGVGSDGESEWVYFGFSHAPNLANDETKDGFNLISTRVKWDDDVVESVQLRQDWGAKFIHFGNYRSAISKIGESNTLLLELDWYGQGKVYFRFSLAGSAATIEKMRASCGPQQ